jgi:hypothetical protein
VGGAGWFMSCFFKKGDITGYQDWNSFLESFQIFQEKGFRNKFSGASGSVTVLLGGLFCKKKKFLIFYNN